MLEMRLDRLEELAVTKSEPKRNRLLREIRDEKRRRDLDAARDLAEERFR
jgi:hypothetical protein